MTTTLRPTGPEEQAEDGSRIRAYEICVNSRPVGRVRLSTDLRFGPAAGRIEQLVVDEGEQHRGRGAVAALAAEEVLRQWGCRRVEAVIPAAAAAARHLAQALGYQERGRHLVKTLTRNPQLPDGSAAHPMTEAEFSDWREIEVPHFAAVLSERGVPQDQAQQWAARSFAALLPAGASTHGAALRVLTHGGAPVGTLWLRLRDDTHAGADTYVYDVQVPRRHRGHGHGRTLMLLAERESLTAGAETVGLNVFAGNAPALNLYESLGYRPTDYTLHKSLS